VIRLLLAKLDCSNCRLRSAAALIVVCATLLWNWPALAQTQFVPAVPTPARSNKSGAPVMTEFLARQLRSLQARAAKQGHANTPFDRVFGPMISRQQLAQSGARKPSPAEEVKGTRRQALATDAAASVNLNFPGFYTAPYIFASPAVGTSALSTSVTGDFDHDGKPDIATINMDGTVNVILNGGSANPLQGGISYSDTSLLTRLPLLTYAVAADMNADGYTDIVGMDSLNSAIVLWINNGKGGFLPAVSVPVLGQNGSVFNEGGAIAVGDVNGDGALDVVAVSYAEFVASFQGFVNTNISTQVFAGDGKGNLEPPTEVDTALGHGITTPFGQGMQLADMNGDGTLDIAIDMQINDTFVENFVVVALNHGGTFDQFVRGNNSSNIQHFFNQAGGHVEVADINGDGFPDVLWNPGSEAVGSVVAAFGDGTGNLSNQSFLVLGDNAVETFHLADVNGDGKSDLITYDAGGVAVYPGNGDGTFSAYPANLYAASDNGAFTQPAIIDYNGDGKADVIDVNSILNTASFYAGNGDGSFQGAGSINPGGISPGLLQVQGSGDINGDGIPDLTALTITAGSNPLLGTGIELVSLLSDGKGGFQQVTGLTSGILRSVGLLSVATGTIYPTVVDFNGDGFADIVFATGNGIYTALSNGDGTFQVPVLVPGLALQCAANLPDAGNVDGSGHTSLVFAYPGDASCGGSGPTPPGIVVLINDGKGNFTASLQAVGNEPFQARLADLNGDGYPDLLLSDFDTNNGVYALYTLPNQGAAAAAAGNYFNPAQRTTLLSGYAITDILVGDYNGDGIPDLALATDGQVVGIDAIFGSEGVVLLPGQGGFKFGAPSLVGQGTVPSWIQWADINQDGIPDLVIASSFPEVNEAPVFGLSVLPGLGNGLFAPPVSQVVPNNDTYVFTGDFNQDGATDVVVNRNAGVAFSGVFLNRGADNMTLSVANPSVAQGSNVTLTANLKTTFTDFAPTGTVTFTSNGAVLGTAWMSNGVASFTYSASAAGVYPVAATYAGDGHFNQASATGSYTVAALAPAITTSASATSVNLTSGQSNIVTLTLSANPTYNGAVTFAASATGTGVSVAVNPTTVTLAGGQTQQVSVVIASGTLKSAALHKSSNVWGRVAGTISLAALFPLFLFRARKFRRKLLLVLVLFAGLGCLAGLNGCSGGSSTATKATGTQTVTVTATPSVAGVAPQTTTLTVTLQ
jgi:hypothetical protein